MTKSRLINPTSEYEAQAFDYIKEFRDFGSDINGTGDLDGYEDYTKWLEKVETDRDPDRVLPPLVQADTYFLLREEDSRIIGMVNIRHKLSDFLFREGGHIGYSIRPTERNRGYATLLLKMALKRCKELNLNRVLVTCDKNNIASEKSFKRTVAFLKTNFSAKIIRKPSNDTGLVFNKHEVDMNIFLASQEHCEIVHKIVQETIKAIYPRYYPAGVVEFFLAYHSEKAIREAIEKNQIYLLQTEDGNIGTGSVETGYIGRLYILPPYQKRGYGTKLMDFLESIVFEQSPDVTVDASLPATIMYEKRGYQSFEFCVEQTESGDVLCYHRMVLKKP